MAARRGDRSGRRGDGRAGGGGAAAGLPAAGPGRGPGGGAGSGRVLRPAGDLLPQRLPPLARRCGAAAGGVGLVLHSTSAGTPELAGNEAGDRPSDLTVTTSSEG